MKGLATTPFEFPDESALEFYALDRLEHPVLRSAAEYWQELRGQRRFPSRGELKPSAIPSALRHMALVRVIDGGTDFEFRIVGETLASAFSIPLNFRKLGEIAGRAPATASTLGHLYARCVRSGEPIALRGMSGRNAETGIFTHIEAVILPMGSTGVDHLITLMVWEGRV